MSARPTASADDDEVRVVEELLRGLGKAQRALQMYLPNNPMYGRALEQVRNAFAPVWSITGRLVLDVTEDGISWEGNHVFRQEARAEGLAWQFYKDGLRRVTFIPGVEEDEIVRFLQVVNQSRMLPADASDDLLTLLWEQEFVLVSYVFVEVLGEGVEFLQEAGGAAVRDATGDARDEVAEARAGGMATTDDAPSMVDLTDFDATPYFLTDAEVRMVHDKLEDEYRRDFRQAALDALLDILEGQRDATIRHEVIALLDDILPVQLSTGGLRAVARILRELRVISARAAGLDEALHQAVLSFEDRLSHPDILDQLFRLLTDSAVRPSEEDVGEVLRELKPSALPAILAHIGRIADSNMRRVLEGSVESIARSQPGALAALLERGPADTVVPAISLAARLGLGQLVPVVITHLRTGDEPARLAAVRALAEFGTASAIDALEEALDDPERAVRQAALHALMERGGSGGLLPRLESLLFDGRETDWERSERRALYEAYGSLAGAAAVPKLQGMLEPRGVFRRKAPPEIRACALYALGKVRNFEARMVVDRFRTDKEAVVRTAANTLLRDWQP
ncbi:MAG: HEAT repeat domain-containing protein [Gemmatimonadales bacterium]